MDFIKSWHDGRDRSKVLLSAIPALEPDPEVKVTDLEFLYKSQNVCTQVYIAMLLRPFNEFQVYLAW